MRPVREEEIDGFIFYEFERFAPETLILALPDVGLVGAITGLHLIRELNLRDIVGIDSYHGMPPVTVIIDGKPKHPVRIYVNDTGSLGVLLTDVPFSPAAIVAFSIAVVKFARSRGVRRIISVTGLGNPMRFQMDKPNLYVLGSSPELQSEVQRLTGARTIPGGILVGPYSIVLKESMRRGLDNVVLLADAFIDIPDAEAAIVTVEALSKILGISIDTKKLEEEADKIKLRLKELMRETKDVMAKMGKGYEYRPTLMYT